jgi:general secretion pathway protein D
VARPHERRCGGAFLIALVLAGAAACASRGAVRAAQRAERHGDFDRAVVEYTNAVRSNPDNRTARQSLDRVRLRASQEHYVRGRRLAAAERYEEASLELQVATELNPTDAAAETELREVRQRLRTKVAVSREGKTELQTLIERARAAGPPGLDLPLDAKLPESFRLSDATARMAFLALAKYANLNITFDPAFRGDDRVSADFRNSTLVNALSSLTATTHTFYRVTAPRTITIIPDTPAKRREYEEQVVQTFFVSNAELKEVIDLLRIVVDVRQISQTTGVNSISLKDTPERIAAAAKLIAAIDKARPEVVINVELLSVDRTRLHEYGLQIASPGSNGIAGAADVNRTDLTLQSLRNLTQADVFVTGVPALYLRLLKNDAATRTLASPHLRTIDGVAAQARFGDRVPITVTTFAPIATGGINQQPISSFVYENIGVNIDITPRTHHNDEVSLTLKVSVSNISGSLNGQPTFGNREITTTIRLKDGETNMLAGLIRDEERTILAGIPGLSDLPLVGKLFASNHKETLESDIVLTLTPHIVRVLDISEDDLRPFRIGRDPAGPPTVDLPAITLPPRDKELEPIAPGAAPDTAPATTPFPQPLQPPLPTQPLKGGLPGAVGPILPPTPPAPTKKGGGGS